MWKPLALAAALTLGAAAAHAATLGLRPAEAPRIDSTAVTADYDAAFDLLAIDSPALTVTLDGPGTPPPLDSLTVFGGLGAATLDVFGPADPVVPAISADLTGVGSDVGVLELLFATTADTSGRFGPRLFMEVQTGAADPLAGFSATGTTATIATPVPLPPAGIAMLAALAAGAAAGRHAGLSGRCL